MKIVNITKESRIPLIGSIAFGIVLRGGNNLVQVRPTTVCNLNCGFCSTDCGFNPKLHEVDYVVEIDYLLEEVKKIAEFLGDVEINIDSAGEPTTYSDLLKLIKGLKQIKDVKRISMQTNGFLLTKEKIKLLKESGLDKINLSIHSLDNNLAKELSGNENYDVNKIINLAKEIVKNMDLMLTPVWLPKVNDIEIEKLIKFSKEINCRIGIQKYEIYKYSRRIKKAKKITYYKFYKQLESWEKKFNIKLKFGSKDLKLEKRKRLPLKFKIGEKIQVKIVAFGWLKEQMLASSKNVCVTVVDCKSDINNLINVKILENKNNIYIAEKI